MQKDAIELNATQPATISAGMTPEQFAKAIQYHPEHVRFLIRKGKITALKFGREWRIPPDESARIFANGLPA